MENTLTVHWDIADCSETHVTEIVIKALRLRKDLHSHLPNAYHLNEEHTHLITTPKMHANVKITPRKDGFDIFVSDHHKENQSSLSNEKSSNDVPIVPSA